MQRREPPQIEMDVPIRNIRDTLCALVMALNELQLGAQRINIILERCIRIACVGCTIQLHPSEIHQLIAATSREAVDQPRLERLLLGYCARNGCDSRYYKLEVLDPQGLDWQQIFRRTLELQGEIEPLGSNEAEPQQLSQQKRHASPLLILALVLLAISALLTISYWKPWLRLYSEAPSPYQVDTNTLYDY